VTEMTDRRRTSAGSLLTPQRVTAGVLAVVALVFVLQNRAEVTLQFLGIRVTATLWLASLALLVVGILIGALWTSRSRPS
jgi:lipopolysaccharide assembly protein A